jgi:hypothetical protein
MPLGRLPTVLLAFLVLLGAVPLGAAAADVYYHREMTDRALRELGWTDPLAIDHVCEANVATDLARLPAHSQIGLRILMPGPCTHLASVDGLAESAPYSERSSQGHHFNSLYSFADIARRWAEVDRWVSRVANTWNARPGGATREEVLTLLGVVAHQVQDFYSHSNWVGILDGYTPGDLDPDEFPLWEELVADRDGWREAHPEFDAAAALAHLRRSNAGRSAVEDEGGLQTGRIRHEVIEGDPVPWKHRHHGGDTMRVVHELARRETLLWVARVLERVPLPDEAAPVAAGIAD